MQIRVPRDETEVPINLTLTESGVGPVAGATAVYAIRDGDTPDSWLDFNDNTFKTSAWTTRQATLTGSATQDGVYTAVPGFNLNATNLPAGSDHIIIEYEVTAPSSLAAIASDIILIDARLEDRDEPMLASLSQTEHDATQSAIAALNDPTAGVIADAVLDEALSAHVTSGSLGAGVARLYGDNTRTKLYFSVGTITGGREVPDGAVSHMEVSVRDEGGAFPGTLYYVVFNYEAGDEATTSPRSSSVDSSAPVDGSFTSTAYPL